MNRHLVALVVLAASLPAAAQQPPPAEKQLASIRGTVVNAAGGEGLRKAFVNLTAKGRRYPTQTDDRGMFFIEGIAPGTYTLDAERQGYVDRASRDGSNQQLRITLAPGQALTDVVVKLRPQAILSGRVVDEDGDPWTHANINLLRSTLKDGRRQIENFDGGQVNDLGEFRIGELPPGTYYLNAEPDEHWEAEHTPRPKDGKEPEPPRRMTWYPSALGVQAAGAIHVTAGSQMSGLEIRMRRGAVHRIRGTLAGLENIPAPTVATFGERGIRAVPDDTGSDGGRGVIHSDGSFIIEGVEPGAYELQVRQDFPNVTIGRAKVHVADTDVDNVTIQLIPPGPLKGTIRVAEPGSLNPAGLLVGIEPSTPGVTDSFANAKPDGSFEIPLIGADKYRVTVTIPAAGAYLKELRFGNTVSNDENISLQSGGGTLELILSTRGARLTGIITTTADHKPAEDAEPQVVLIPAVPARGQSSGKAIAATVDQNGVYSFEQMLAPGAYKLYAFDGLPDGLWDDSEFMKEVAAKGVYVRLAETESQRVDVPLILKSELAPTLQKLGVD